MGTAQEKGKDCARDAHMSPQILERQLTPLPARLRFGAEAKGRAREGQERGYGTAGPVAPSPFCTETMKRDEFGGEETTASRRGVADNREPVAKEMPSLRGHG